MRQRFSRRPVGAFLKPVLSVLLACGLATGAVACSENKTTNDVVDNTPTIGYAAGVDLVTLNAGSGHGVATRADMISARIYPGMFVRGPSGQFVPNTDVATAQYLPGENNKVVYRINVDAQYSDGVPLTCTDFLLAWRAQVTPGFQSFGSLYDDIADIDCEVGARKFTVTFKDKGGSRWQELFGTGTVLPSHAIAHTLGLTMDDVNSRLHSGDATSLEPIAEVWNHGFDLDHYDPQLMVSLGPYKVAAVDPGKTVTLEANDKYPGDQPATPRIVIYAFGKEPSGNGDRPAPDVSDLTRRSALPWITDPGWENTFTATDTPGQLADHIVLATGGVFADPAARRAFAACVDQPQVAAASSEIAGITVNPVGLFISGTDTSDAKRNTDIAQAHFGVDIPAAEKLRGTTIRLAHLPGHRRYSALVESIAASCAPAGITVVDASDSAPTLDELKNSDGTGVADGYLTALSPFDIPSKISADSGDAPAIRAEELRLWDDVPTVPLAAQPRVAIIRNGILNTVPNTGVAGIGWNMDRWAIDAHAATTHGKASKNN